MIIEQSSSSTSIQQASFFVKETEAFCRIASESVNNSTLMIKVGLETILIGLKLLVTYCWRHTIFKMLLCFSHVATSTELKWKAWVPELDEENVPELAIICSLSCKEGYVSSHVHSQLTLFPVFCKQWTQINKWEDLIRCLVQVESNDANISTCQVTHQSP